ncbi:MAG: hypothetical protein FWE62_07070 [Firmicutes bacterium]|nr:hypothetical protein [Bacillota bacterium]
MIKVIVSTHLFGSFATSKPKEGGVNMEIMAAGFFTLRRLSFENLALYQF